ncbi:MAG: tetratricopeptide repeat protein [Candidatus Limnocylindria bacterium]
MGTRSSDFNYKVALASGLKSLHAGRLRQAEEQFRYLLTRFPAADGGYRGLAKVLIEEEDRPAALRMLLDGGAAVAKSGQRAGAIGLYRDAAALDPHDLAAHRRLAAALMLAGEQTAAADEYARYIQLALMSGATERARHEAEFALERVPPSIELAKVARTLGFDVEEPKPAPVPPSAPTPAVATQTERKGTLDRAALMRSAFGGVLSRHESAPPTQPSWREAPPATTEVEPAPEAAAVGAAASDALPVAQPASSSDPWASESESVSDPQAVTLGGSDGEQPAEDADSRAVEADAARYLAKRDPRGGQTALEAARRYIADGRNDAASDLLLQLIASGVADHDAQRLLVDVVRTLGKRDVAKAKCQLLVQALRLDGREDLAAEVEQLALAD